MPVGDAEPREEEPDREWIRAADLKTRSGAQVDLRPRPQEHLQALPRLVPPGKGDRVLTPRSVDYGRDEDAVRHDLVVPRQPLRRRVARPLRDCDALVDPAREKAPGRHPELHPAELSGRVVGDDDRRGGHCEHRDARDGRHRLVQVEHVEALPPEHAPDAANRPGAEDDVRERAVRRHDHGPADRDDIRRRVAVAPDPRVQRTRELARRVIAHHQPHLVPARLQRLRLQLGMLDNRAPERPRERHHDADLHGGIVFTRRRHRGRLAPRRPARRRSSFSSKQSRKPSCTPAR